MTIHTRMSDAAALAYFNTQLMNLEAEIYKKQYPEKVWDKIIPVVGGGWEWASTTAVRTSDRTGKAKFGVNLNADDVPMIDLNRAMSQAPIYEGTVGYGYSIKDIAVAAKLGQRLDADLAIAARDAYEDQMEDIALIGYAPLGLTGLLNSASVTAVAAPAGTGGTTWATKTGDEILADVNSLLLGVYTGSNTVEMADHLALSAERYSLISSKRLGDTNMTILEFIQKANAYTAKTKQPLSIVELRQLATAGAASSQRAVAYKKDKNVLRVNLEMALRFEAPQQRVFRFEVPGMFRSSGFHVLRPGAMRYFDGI
jgi:hypothetical protein